MEILDQFGFDLRLLIAQIVNFLVIAYFFKRFLYKPLISSIQKRDDAIKRGLKDAEKAAVALERAEEKSDEILKKASKEADKILEQAKHEAGTIKDSMLDATRADIEKLMNNTKEQLEMERASMLMEMKTMSLDLSKKILEQSINGLFDKKTQEDLVKKGFQKIKE